MEHLVGSELAKQRLAVLLETRRGGRPPNVTDPAQLQTRLVELEDENRALRHQPAAAEVRRELAETLPRAVHAAAG